jgi:hypothetical protein
VRTCAVSGAARTVSHQPGPVGSVLRFCGSRTIPPNMTAIPAEVTATLAPCRAIGHVGDGAVSACSTPLAASECSRSVASGLRGAERAQQSDRAIARRGAWARVSLDHSWCSSLSAVVGAPR